PDWVRAACVFSTFTSSAGRPSATRFGSGRPVSGATGGACVVVGASVVVVVVGAARFLALPPPPEAAATATPAITSTATVPPISSLLRRFTYISRNRLMRSSRGG